MGMAVSSGKGWIGWVEPRRSGAYNDKDAEKRRQAAVDWLKQQSWVTSVRVASADADLHARKTAHVDMRADASRNPCTQHAQMDTRVDARTRTRAS
jgi:hypothetical protein